MLNCSRLFPYSKVSVLPVIRKFVSCRRFHLEEIVGSCLKLRNSDLTMFIGQEIFLNNCFVGAFPLDQPIFCSFYWITIVINQCDRCNTICLKSLILEFTVFLLRNSLVILYN